MMRLSLTAPLLGALMILSAGCSMDFEPSLVEEGTILALRATQDEANDQQFELEALTVGVDALTWTACGAPWVGTENGLECVTPTWTLTPSESEQKATLDLGAVPIPDEYKDLLESVYVLVDGDGDEVVPAVLAVSLTAAPNNPELVGVLLDGVAPDEWAGTNETEIEVAPVWSSDEASEGTTTSFYTTAGAMDPWRITEDGSTTLTLEGEETNLTLYVISRFLGEGATWTKVEVSL